MGANVPDPSTTAETKTATQTSKSVYIAASAAATHGSSRRIRAVDPVVGVVDGVARLVEGQSILKWGWVEAVYAIEDGRGFNKYC